MERLVKDAPSDLYLFGELYLTGYMCRDRFPKLGEELSGPSVKRVSRLASDVGGSIIFGMPERDEETGVLYNSSVYVGRDGHVEAYRKLYPANFGPFEELEYFGRGNDLRVLDTEFGRIGLLICYDTFFPEVAKGLAIRGAEVLACISAAPSTSKPLFDLMIPARAVENTCFFLYSNLVGTELNVVFQGGTQAVGPRGDRLAQASDFKEGVVSLKVDLADLSVARKFRPTIRDTRPEILAKLAGLLEEPDRSTQPR